MKEDDMKSGTEKIIWLRYMQVTKNNIIESLQWLEEQLGMFGLKNCPKIGRSVLTIGLEENSQSSRYIRLSDAVSGWAGWALAHLEFGVSVNSFPTKGADYTHLFTACQPRFEILTSSL